MPNKYQTPKRGGKGGSNHAAGSNKKSGSAKKKKINKAVDLVSVR
jgi:hypothetical protein